MSHFSAWIDGPIVGLYLLVTMAAGLWVRKYVRKVEHFLLAGREMDVFLGIASLATTEFGIVTCMYTAEAGYRYGFAGATPGICQAVAMLLIGMTGFCIRPLRDSGVLTIPELLLSLPSSRVGILVEFAPRRVNRREQFTASQQTVGSCVPFEYERRRLEFQRLFNAAVDIRPHTNTRKPGGDHLGGAPHSSTRDLERYGWPAAQALSCVSN